MIRKKLLAALAITALFLGDYLYWTLPQPLDRCLPGAVYSSEKADLIRYDAVFDSEKIDADEAALEAIFQALREAEVTRRPKFSTMSQPFFYLYLYYPDGYTCLTVVENGSISVVPDHRSDRRLYFDGGEELFDALQELAGRK